MIFRLAGMFAPAAWAPADYQRCATAARCGGDVADGGGQRAATCNVWAAGGQACTWSREWMGSANLCGERAPAERHDAWTATTRLFQAAVLASATAYQLAGCRAAQSSPS